ncbi:MAG: hypothetical protein RL322_2522 [Pseudomonadota bacterium]|jgi:cell division protein FtsN
MQRPRFLLAGSRTQQGNLMLGLMVGMLVGLAIAVGVALFVTRAPLPFVNKIARSGDRLAELSKPGSTVPDPNRAITGASRPPAPPGEASTAPTQATPSASDPAPSFAPSAPSPGGEPAPPSSSGERGLYLLQAGAFRSSDDADNMRAKLALIGFEARVSAAEVGSERLYRVRIGPYIQQDDVNLARFRLAENGIEATVVRQR